MQIAYATTYEVFNTSTWDKSQAGLAGAGYYMAKALERESVSLNYLGPVKKKRFIRTKLKWEYYSRFTTKDYYRWAEPSVVKDYAVQLAEKLSETSSDLVLCPENAVPIAYLECQQPIVLWTDSTLAGLFDFYPWLSNLCKETQKNIYNLEKSALNRCELVMFPSDWAAEAAMKIYGIDSSKVKVIPWGANLECQRTTDDIYTFVESRDPTRCKLLFVGVEWQRKGGDVVLEVVETLNKRGWKTELTVVGCKSIGDRPIPDNVKLLGFINKNTPEGKNKIDRLFAESHFLVLPTRADTYGHVFCEANSFGVPCLATNIAGIPTVIKNGLNGQTFSQDASSNEYGEAIAHYLENYDDYRTLALSSFQEYQSRLNWSVAAKTARQTLSELIS